MAVYRGTRLTEFLARRLVSCRYMSLPNLLIDDELMPEFPFSGGVDPWIEPVTGILDNWIANPSTRQAVIDRMARLNASIGASGASGRAAEVILERMSPPRLARAA